MHLIAFFRILRGGGDETNLIEDVIIIIIILQVSELTPFTSNREARRQGPFSSLTRYHHLLCCCRINFQQAYRVPNWYIREKRLDVEG